MLFHNLQSVQAAAVIPNSTRGCCLGKFFINTLPATDKRLTEIQSQQDVCHKLKDQLKWKIHFMFYYLDMLV